MLKVVQSDHVGQLSAADAGYGVEGRVRRLRRRARRLLFGARFGTAVRAGTRFVTGKLVERVEDQQSDTRPVETAA
jgi:hypothetical protein